METNIADGGREENVSTSEKLSIRRLQIGNEYVVMNDDCIVVPEFLNDLESMEDLEAALGKSCMLYANTPFKVLDRRAVYITQTDGRKHETYPWYFVEIGITAKHTGWINSLVLEGKLVQRWKP